MVKKSYSRIMVLRALQLGDLLCAVPALRALRHWQPQAHITLCGLPWAAEFVSRFNHLVDEFEKFPGCPGIPESDFDIEQTNKWTNSIRERRYDLVIQLHGSGTYLNDFVRTLGARDTAGFHPQHQTELALDQSIGWPETGHEIERLKSLLLALGAKDCGDELELPISQQESESAYTELLRAGLNRGQPYICIHAGGRSLSRRWPTDKYVAVAERLLDDNYAVVLTGVPDEAHLATQINVALGGQCINMVGRTSFGQLVSMIDGADLMLSNDTAVSHIAAARKVPSVVIVLGSELDRWFPLNRHLHTPVMIDIACRPCMHSPCPIGFPCAEGVTVEMVQQAVYAKLRTSTAPEPTNRFITDFHGRLERIV